MYTGVLADNRLTMWSRSSRWPRTGPGPACYGEKSASSSLFTCVFSVKSRRRMLRCKWKRMRTVLCEWDVMSVHFQTSWNTILPFPSKNWSVVRGFILPWYYFSSLLTCTLSCTECSTPVRCVLYRPSDHHLSHHQFQRRSTKCSISSISRYVLWCSVVFGGWWNVLYMS